MTYNEKLTKIVLPKVKAHIKIGDNQFIIDYTKYRDNK